MIRCQFPDKFVWQLDVRVTITVESLTVSNQLPHLNIPVPDLFSISIWRRERTQRLPRRAGPERTKRFLGCTLTNTTLLRNIKSLSAIFQIFFPSSCKISLRNPGESGSLDLMLAMMKDVREDIERLKEKVFKWGMRKQILDRAVIHVYPCTYILHRH